MGVINLLITERVKQKCYDVNKDIDIYECFYTSPGNACKLCGSMMTKLRNHITKFICIQVSDLNIPYAGIYFSKYYDFGGRGHEKKKKGR